MKLCASLIVRNELSRYLETCIQHLLECADEIRVLDDGSDDGTYEWLTGLNDARVVVLSNTTDRDGEPAFFNHAQSRNRLLQFTLEGKPTHILAIDADEFVDDGAQLRRACEDRPPDVWKLCLEEVWEIDGDRLQVRQDGGWSEHDVPMVWRPDRVRRPLAIADRGHATGRVPEAVYKSRRTAHACCSLLHFGWTNLAERDERYARYAIGDAGKFHAKRHIDSIMWAPDRVRLTARDWPEGLAAYKDALLERATTTTEVAKL